MANEGGGATVWGFMSYATDDFAESLRRTEWQPSDVARVEAAWGKGDGMGTDAGHWKWSEDGATDWRGGFLFRLKDGSYVYLTGWCDYTGWGCQDGVEVHRFTERPTFAELLATGSDDYMAPPPESEWDIEPADLNKWLGSGEE